MPGLCRLGDASQAMVDVHGSCPACPHPQIAGPSIVGSPNVNVNKLPAIRVGDRGLHAACCNANTWTAMTGSTTVYINGKPAHRMNDIDQHCGGVGKMLIGSLNVIVGD